jgi:predicted aconitase with swiveling domain
MKYEGRVIKRGRAEGTALVSTNPLSFLGGVDPDTGTVLDPASDIRGASIAGRILVFPTGKGSTVGSYILLRLGTSGAAPAGIINASSEPIVSVGAIIADIPMVDHIPLEGIETGDTVIIDGGTVTVYKRDEKEPKGT